MSHGYINIQNLLFQNTVSIRPGINIRIPTVGEIMSSNEEGYYDLVYALTAMPIDCMVGLEDAGIDFTTINDYDLFLLLFNGIRSNDTSLVFGDLDFSEFVFDKSKENDEYILRNSSGDIIIDRLVHTEIARVLRKIHGLTPNTKKPADEGTRRYLIERARKKLKRKKQYKSQLEDLIISIVNTEQCKYNFEGIKELSIYQFNESVRQIIKKVDYDNRMYGVYTGTISAKDLSQDDLTWFSQNKI